MTKNIELRQEQENELIYVSADFLQDLGVPYKTIQLGLNRGSESWRGSLKTGIRYDSLLPKYKQLITAHYAGQEGISPSEWDIEKYLRSEKERRKREEIKEAVLRLRYVAAEEWSRVLGWYNKNTANANEASKSAHYYFTIKLCESIKKGYEKMGYTSKIDFYQAVVDILRVDKVAAAPASVQMLQNRMRRYKAAAAIDEKCQSLMSGSLGSQNKKRVKTNEQEEILQMLMVEYTLPAAFAQKYNQTVAAKYKEGNMDWAKKDKEGNYRPAYISETSARRYLAQYSPEITQAMLGQGKYDNLYKEKSHRKAPSKYNSLWVMDGTPIDIRCKKTITTEGDNGKWVNKTDEWYKLYFYCVIDAATWEIIGYSLDEKTENHEGVYQAVSMALNHTGCRPQQLMYDNSGANLMLCDLWDKLADYGKNTPAQPMNPQGKVIEPLFRQFKSRYERYCIGWTGLGIKSKMDSSQANVDKVLADKKAIFTDQELKQEVINMIKHWNTSDDKPNKESKWRAPATVKNEMQNAGTKLEFDERFDLCTIFLSNGKTYQYHKGGRGLTIQRRGKSTYYNIGLGYSDTERDQLGNMLMRGDRQYQVRIDLSQPENIWLYKKGIPILDHNNQIVMLTDDRQITYFSQAISEHNSEDRRRLTRHANAQKISSQTGKDSVKRMRMLKEKHSYDLAQLDWRNQNKQAHNEAENIAQAEILGYEIEVLEEKPSKRTQTKKTNFCGLDTEE
jgi:hypothetical protein